MADVFTKAKRSAVMSRIRGAGNKDTELRLIVLMRAAGIVGWRRGKSLRLISRDFPSRNAGEARCGPCCRAVAAAAEVGPQRGWRRGVTLRLAQRSWAVQGHRSKVKGPNGASASAVRGRRPSTFDLPLSTRAALRRIAVRPDFVFPQQRLVVFVDGCFWHGCPKHATWPKNNAAFWRKKIEGNIVRDRLQNRLLRKHGWRVVRIWEHGLTMKSADRTIARLRRVLLTLG